MKALGHRVVDRRPVERDGGRDRLAIPASDIIVAIVGKHIERGQPLQPPGFTASPISHKRLTESAEITPDCCPIGVGARAIHSLNEELNGAGSIALAGAGEPATVMSATAELTSDDHAGMLLVVQVTDGGGL